MENKISRIVIGLIAILLMQVVFGILAIYLHEMTHKFDFRNIEKTNEEICVLMCDEGFGSYTFEFEFQKEEIERIDQYTETHAGLVTIAVYLLYLLVALLILENIIREEK